MPSPLFTQALTPFLQKQPIELILVLLIDNKLHYIKNEVLQKVALRFFHAFCPKYDLMKLIEGSTPHLQAEILLILHPHHLRVHKVQYSGAKSQKQTLTA